MFACSRSVAGGFCPRLTPKQKCCFRASFRCFWLGSVEIVQKLLNALINRLMLSALRSAPLGLYCRLRWLCRQVPQGREETPALGSCRCQPCLKAAKARLCHSDSNQGESSGTQPTRSALTLILLCELNRNQSDAFSRSNHQGDRQSKKQQPTGMTGKGSALIFSELQHQ